MTFESESDIEDESDNEGNYEVKSFYKSSCIEILITFRCLLVKIAFIF